MTDHQKPSLEHSVMDAIHSGRVQMRPRWKFVLSGMLAGLGTAILVCTLLFIVSFVIFTLRRNGGLFVPMFGMGGFFAFFAALPGILIILLVLFVGILEILVRRYRVGYRTPLLVSVIAILLIVLLGGYAIERTRIHEELLREAGGPGGLPLPLSFMYHPNSGHVPDIYHGTIIALIPGGFLLADEDGAGTTTVLIDQSTKLPPSPGVQRGDEVVVFGQTASGTVHAFGVREVSD